MIRMLATLFAQEMSRPRHARHDVIAGAVVQPSLGTPSWLPTTGPTPAERAVS